MPAKIEAYVSNDGKLFRSEIEARIHEAAWDLRQYVNGMGKLRE